MDQGCHPQHGIIRDNLTCSLGQEPIELNEGFLKCHGLLTLYSPTDPAQIPRPLGDQELRAFDDEHIPTFVPGPPHSDHE